MCFLSLSGKPILGAYCEQVLLLIQAQAESEICQEKFPIQDLKWQQGSTDTGRSCPSLKSHSGRAERKSHFSSSPHSKPARFLFLFLSKCVSWAGRGWMCPSVKTVAAGNTVLPAECVTKTIQFSFFPFISLFRTTPRCSVYWQAGGKGDRWCDSGGTVYFSTNKNGTWDPCTAEKLETWNTREKGRLELTFQCYRATQWWLFFCTWNLQFYFLLLWNMNKTNGCTDVQFKACLK